MDVIVKLVVLIILLGSLQGLLLSFILSRKKIFNKTSNGYLSVFILAFSVSNLHYIAHILGFMKTYAWLNYLSFPWTFLIPVVFYLFIVYLLKPDHKLLWYERCLFIPFTLQCIFHLVLFLLSFYKSPLLQQYENVIYILDIKVETILSLILNLIFVPSILLLLNNYESKLRDNYSEISSSSVAWLKRLVLALVGIWILWACPAIFQVFTGITTPILDLVLWLLMSVCIYWIGYATYFRRDIFFAKRLFPSETKLDKLVVETESIEIVQKKNEAEKVVEVETKKTSKSTENSRSQNDILEEHYKRMIKIIEGEKLYKNPDFNLSMLSDKISLSANYLSQIINKKTERNFYTLINNYRVEAAKEMIASSEFENYTLVSIGLEAGFKSRSSFFKIFKEKTNATPNQFKKSLK